MKNFFNPTQKLLKVVVFTLLGLSIITHNRALAQCFTASLNVTAISCYGLCDGSVSASTKNGSGQFSYSWGMSGQTGASITGVCAGTLVMSITDNVNTTCSVTLAGTVTEPAAIQAFVKVNNATCGSNDGKATITLTLGGTGAYTYNWLNSATGTVVDNLSAGSYTVTLNDARGCTGSTVAAVNCVTGLIENNSTMLINISPNPSNGNFVLDCTFEKSDRAIISLNTILGETVMLIDDVLPNGIYKKQIDTGHITSGMYFLVVQQDHQRLVRKVIIR